MGKVCIDRESGLRGFIIKKIPRSIGSESTNHGDQDIFVLLQ